MLKRQYLLILIILIPFVATLANAAPSLDGNMDDWDPSNYSTFDGYVNGSSDFKVNRIGTIIDDKKLYFGLDTGFELNYHEGGYDPGDINITFTQGGSQVGEFGIRFDIDGIQATNSGQSGVVYNSDYKLYEGANWSTRNEQGPGGSTPYRVDDSVGVGSDGVIQPMWPGQNDTSNASGTFLGFYNDAAAYQRYGGTSSDPDSNILEGVVDLSILTGALAALNTQMAYDVEILWTMSCGNDALEYKTTVPGTPIPEPATLMLFGFGLIGISALGRKKSTNQA